jgi:GNAT superfamily N-acetyltransferase
LSFNVRPITATDEQFLWDMLYLAIYIPEGVTPPPRSIIHEPDIAKYVQGWGRKGDEGLIALADEQPIGAAWLRFFTHDNPSYGYVADDIPELTMAMLSEHRGKGVGTRLLTDLLKQTPTMSLSSDPANPVMNLYKRLGFKEVGISGTSITMLRTPNAQ